MSYGNTYFPEDFPFGDKKAQYEYGLKKAYKTWDKMVERATIKQEGTPISNMIRHLAYCEHNEYNSPEYFKGFLEGSEEKIRLAILKESE